MAQLVGFTGAFEGFALSPFDPLGYSEACLNMWVKVGSYRRERS